MRGSAGAHSGGVHDSSQWSWQGCACLQSLPSAPQLHSCQQVPCWSGRCTPRREPTRHEAFSDTEQSPPAQESWHSQTPSELQLRAQVEGGPSRWGQQVEGGARARAEVPRPLSPHGSAATLAPAVVAAVVQAPPDLAEGEIVGQGHCRHGVVHGKVETAYLADLGGAEVEYVQLVGLIQRELVGEVGRRWEGLEMGHRG